jgi:hypothetical protein
MRARCPGSAWTVIAARLALLSTRVITNADANGYPWARNQRAVLSARARRSVWPARSARPRSPRTKRRQLRCRVDGSSIAPPRPVKSIVSVSSGGPSAMR